MVDPVARRRHPAVRRAAAALAGQQRRRARTTTRSTSSPTSTRSSRTTSTARPRSRSTCCVVALVLSPACSSPAAACSRRTDAMTRSRHPAIAASPAPAGGRPGGAAAPWSLVMLARLRAVLRDPDRLAAAGGDQDRRTSSISSNPFSLGLARQFAANWDAAVRVPGRRGHARGSATRSSTRSARWCITLVVTSRPATRWRMMEFRRPAALLVATLVVMLMPNTALVLPIFLEINARRLIGTPLSVDPAVLVLPVRGLPDLHLLLHRACPRTCWPRRGSTAAREIAGVPPGRAAAGRAGRRAGRLLQLRGQLEQLLPAVRDAAGQRPVPDPGRAWPDAAARRPRSTRSSARAAVQLPELALATLVAITPVLVVFLFSQRFLVAGMLAGATKG